MAHEDAKRVLELIKEMAERNNVERCQKELRQLMNTSIEANVALRDIVTEGKTNGMGLIADGKLREDAQKAQLLILGYGQDELGTTRLGTGTGIVLAGKLGDTPSLDLTRLENSDTIGQYSRNISIVDDYMSRQDYGQIANDARSSINSMPSLPTLNPNEK